MKLRISFILSPATARNGKSKNFYIFREKEHMHSLGKMWLVREREESGESLRSAYMGSVPFC